jgi:hypothetical protein
VYSTSRPPDRRVARRSRAWAAAHSRSPWRSRHARARRLSTAPAVGAGKPYSRHALAAAASFASDFFVARYLDRVEASHLVERIRSRSPRRQRGRSRGAVRCRHADDELGRAPLCLAMVDIDTSRCTNDRHGHGAPTGACSGSPSSFARGPRHDLVARYGGEEFASSCPIRALMRRAGRTYPDQRLNEPLSEDVVIR